MAREHHSAGGIGQALQQSRTTERLQAQPREASRSLCSRFDANPRVALLSKSKGDVLVSFFVALARLADLCCAGILEGNHKVLLI